MPSFGFGAARRAGFGIDGCRAERQSSSGKDVCRCKNYDYGPSVSARTVERGAFGPVLKSQTVARFRHFATVLGLMASSRFSCEIEAGPSRRHASDKPAILWVAVLPLRCRACPFHGLLCKPLPVAICRAPVTNVSHSASFHSEEQITQSNQRIKHLGHHIATTSGHGFLSLPDRYRGVAAFRSGRRSGARIRRHFDARIPDRPGHVAVLTTLDILFGRRTKRRQDRTGIAAMKGRFFLRRSR